MKSTQNIVNRPKLRKRQARNQSGQALLVFLGFAAALTTVFLVTFNSGQVTNAKMRAMNAADAAAYSGAVWQARSLNFQAYMNRAMIANEVAIAQSVSLRSWISYLDRFVTNINYITRFIPYLGAATQAVQRVVNSVDNVVQQTLPFAETALRFVNSIESKVQFGMNASGSAVAQDLASKVAALNGAQSTAANTLLFADNSVAWFNLTDSYVGNRRARLRQAALDSRDGFSYARDWNAGLPFIFHIRKQGGTDLIDYDSWKGLDSAKLEINWNFLKGRWNTEIPIGWGGAQAYSNIRYETRTHGETNQWRDRDGRLANQVANRDNARQYRGGIQFPDYRDVSNIDRKARLGVYKLPFSFEVMITDSAIPDSDSALNAKVALQDGTQMSAKGNLVNGAVYALSTACVSFDRPYNAQRQDGHLERPSLFSPYWRASLATEGRRARLLADGSKGLAPVSAILGGETTCS